jgi:hypothetical protein
MTRAIIVPTMAFASRRGRSGKSGYRALKGKLKYFQFRDNRDGHIPQEQGQERWVDRGLGLHYREILKNCDELSTGRVLAWTWVISPDPALMALVPTEAREQLVMNLTEDIVEAYYLARNVDVPEFCYVLHDRLTDPQENHREPLPQLHAHVVLPGSVPTVDGSRDPFYNRAGQGHLDLLRDISTERFEAALDYYVGPDWRRLNQALETGARTPVETTAPDHSELDRRDDVLDIS